jgi:hypothetical protein
MGSLAVDATAASGGDSAISGHRRAVDYMQPREQRDKKHSGWQQIKLVRR